jgi:hypothetical protein
VKGARIAHGHTASSIASRLALSLAALLAFAARESAGGADPGKGEPHVISCSSDVQAAALAPYLDRTDDARRIAERFGARRIASQVEPEGRQPRELARADSWGYSVFNVAAMISMAELGERVGVDIWRFRTGDGRSLRAAHDDLTPYLEADRTWPHSRGGSASVPRGQLIGPLLRAARGLGLEPYDRLYRSFPASEREARRERLLYVRP